MKISIIIAILLCIALYNLTGLVNKLEPKFIYEKDDITFMLDFTGAVESEILKEKQLVLKFNVKKMKEEWVNEYKEYDAPFTHYRVKMVDGTYKYVYYIPTQGFFNDKIIYE